MAPPAAGDLDRFRPDDLGVAAFFAGVALFFAAGVAAFLTFGAGDGDGDGDGERDWP